MSEPTLTATAGGTALLAPLIAQWDTSVAMLLDRLDGLGEDEYHWSPVPDTADLVPDGNGRIVPTADEHEKPMRTIAWTLGHLAQMCWVRADYTDGEHAYGLDQQPFAASADEAIEEVVRATARWRGAVSAAGEQQALQIGYSAYPIGLDPDLPFVDIVWWVNRELIHHGADVATMRDLYVALGG